MKKSILFCLTLLLIPFLVFAKDNKDVISYQIEGTGTTAAQGTYNVRTTVVTKNKKISDVLIAKCAVHGVLFKGFANEQARQHQKPLAGSPMVEKEHADFFEAFFQDNGCYMSYAQMVSSSRSVVKAGKEYKVSAIVTVAKEQLRKDLEAQKILKGLSSGF